MVVLYNPDNNVVDNIKTYYNAVEKIYVIDNSENKNIDVISKLNQWSKIKYLCNKGNRGIAFALNRGAKNAIHDKFDWLLTMDQDTAFFDKSMDLLIDGLEKFSSDPKMAIVAANYYEIYSNDRTSTEYSGRDAVIQSGSIINLKIFKKINGYENKLFIDEVDLDYCYRCKQQNYKIIRVNRAMMKHNRGNLKKNGAIITWNYPPIRYYYIVRNKIYVWKKYRHFIKKIRGNSAYVSLDIIMRMVLKEDDKYKKILAIFLGVIDAVFGKMGKCRWKI